MEVTTTDTNGVAKVKVYALQDAGSGVLRLTIPLKDIRSDGSEIVCNDTDKPYDYRGRKVGPVAYELYK